MPLAPGLFSTSTGWPRRSVILGLMRRDMMSVVLPGGKGTTILIGLEGYDCAHACPAMNTASTISFFMSPPVQSGQAILRVRLLARQLQRSRQPARNAFLDRCFATVVEVVAVRDDLHRARTARTVPEIFGGILLARLPIAANVERGALHLGGELERVGRLGQAVEEALGADRVPPARHQHQLAAAACFHHVARVRSEFLDALAHHDPVF